MRGGSVSESGDMANERSRRFGGWLKQSRHHSPSDDFAVLPMSDNFFHRQKNTLRHSESDVYFEYQSFSTKNTVARYHDRLCHGTKKKSDGDYM